MEWKKWWCLEEFQDLAELLLSMVTMERNIGMSKLNLLKNTSASPISMEMDTPIYTSVLQIFSMERKEQADYVNSEELMEQFLMRYLSGDRVGGVHLLPMLIMMEILKCIFRIGMIIIPPVHQESHLEEECKRTMQKPSNCSGTKTAPYAVARVLH